MHSGQIKHEYGDKENNRNSLNMNIKGVSVMAITNRIDMIPNIINNFITQTYPLKELIIAINITDVDLSVWEEKYNDIGLIRFYRVNESVTLGGCYNYIIPLALFDYIAHFDDDDYYAPKYLDDMTTAMKVSGAEICGKKASYVYFQKKGILAIRNLPLEYTWVNHMDGPTLFYKKSLALDIPFPDITLGVDSDYCWILEQHGISIYSTHRYNHAYLRRGDGSHSWSVNEDSLLSSCVQVGIIPNYKSFVQN